MKKNMAMIGILVFSTLVAGCAATQSPVDDPLVNTYWKLTELGEAPVEVIDNRREAHLVLHAENQRVAGSTGCNRLMGRYRLDGETLRFAQMATTMMACREGEQTEQAFLAALKRVTAWEVAGPQLTLQDDQGRDVAHFEAVHLY